jgi:hypothetical protein
VEIDAQEVAAPERSQFEFWVGSWRVHQEAGTEVTARNEVGWVLDGAVLHERFSAGGDSFDGWSLSVPVLGRGWVQTWVDNTGSYLDFVGGWLGDRMVLERDTGLAPRAEAVDSPPRHPLKPGRRLPVRLEAGYALMPPSSRAFITAGTPRAANTAAITPAMRASATPVRQRMTWHSISAARLVWDWAYLAQGSAKWELAWRLVYERATSDH